MLKVYGLILAVIVIMIAVIAGGFAYKNHEIKKLVQTQASASEKITEFQTTLSNIKQDNANLLANQQKLNEDFAKAREDANKDEQDVEDEDLTPTKQNDTTKIEKSINARHNAIRKSLEDMTK